jgi:hypothetical protein
MTKKNERQDIITVTIVPSQHIKTQKLFCVAVAAALPNAGRCVYWDERKTLGTFRVEFYTLLSAAWGKEREQEAQKWLDAAMPLLEAHGLRVIRADVNERELLGGVFRQSTIIFSTPEYRERANEADKRDREKREAMWLKEPMKPNETESLLKNLKRAVGQGLVHIEGAAMRAVSVRSAHFLGENREAIFIEVSTEGEEGSVWP